MAHAGPVIFKGFTLEYELLRHTCRSRQRAGPRTLPLTVLVSVQGAPPLSKYLLNARWAPSSVLGPGDSAVSTADGDPVLAALRSSRGHGWGSGHVTTGHAGRRQGPWRKQQVKAVQEFGGG